MTDTAISDGKPGLMVLDFFSSLKSVVSDTNGQLETYPVPASPELPPDTWKLKSATLGCHCARLLA